MVSRVARNIVFLTESLVYIMDQICNKNRFYTFKFFRETKPNKKPLKSIYKIRFNAEVSCKFMIPSFITLHLDNTAT